MDVGGCRRTLATIDLEACRHNLRRLRDRVAGKDIWPVVKADAYGHGAVRVARALSAERITGFCVATSTEGRELRQGGVSQPILVMAGLFEGSPNEAYELAVEYGLSCGIQDFAAADRLAVAARAAGIGPVSVHVKLDTGMGRLGVSESGVVDLAEQIDRDPTLSLDGLFSNLATGDSYKADDPGSARASGQAAAFSAACERLEASGLLPPHRTLANSAAIVHHPESWRRPELTGVRPGLAIYGASLTPADESIGLRPAMQFATRVVTVRELDAGSHIGYGSESTTLRRSRIAVLPVGYHDGFPRALSGRGFVSLRGRHAPIIGRISMDLTLIDITDISAARVGDEVLLFGGEPVAAAEPEPAGGGYAATLAAALSAVEPAAAPDTRSGGVRRGPIRVEQVAEWAETIPHEVLSRVGKRVPRHYVADAGADSTRGRRR